MEPVFSLQWSEFAVAKRLSAYFKKQDGYSILLPLSRQEKGIDLAVIKKSNRGFGSKAITIQVKASRTYEPALPKRGESRRFKYYTWFNRFEVSDYADFYFLTAHFIKLPDFARVKKSQSEWYQDCTLVFSNKEMRNLTENLRTVSGKEDSKFGFGFHDLSKVVLTRGDENRELKDYAKNLLENQIDVIKAGFEIK